MKTLSLALALALFASPSIAAPISATEAAKNVGRTVTVVGTVQDAYHASGSGETTIEFASGFQAVFYSDSGALYPDPRDLIGKTVSVRGTVTSDFGVVEIVLRSPNQLEVKN